MEEEVSVGTVAVGLGVKGNTPSNIGSDSVTLSILSRVSEDMSGDTSSVPGSLYYKRSE